MQERELMMLLLGLINDGPDKIKAFRGRAWAAVSKVFKTQRHALTSSLTASNGKISPSDVEHGAAVDASSTGPEKERRFMGLLRRSSTNTGSSMAFWDALKADVQVGLAQVLLNTRGKMHAGPLSLLLTKLSDGVQEPLRRGQSLRQMGLTPEATKMLAGSRKIGSLTRQMMTRLGERNQEEQQAEEALKVLKAQVSTPHDDDIR